MPVLHLGQNFKQYHLNGHIIIILHGVPTCLGIALKQTYIFTEGMIAYSVQWVGYGLDDLVFDSWQGGKLFLFLRTSIWLFRPTQAPGE